jgi:threonine/homoserine/homoserine lactone efflux protein
MAAAAAGPLLATSIRWGSVGPLAITALAVMGSPGPATISLTAAGSAFGVRRCLAYLAGIVVGTTVVLFAVATGLTAALLAAPVIHSALIAVSAAYILWLAYHVATAPPLAGVPGDAVAPSLAGGALLGIANPKAWIAIAAVFAGTRLADTATADAMAKVAVLTVMIVLINAVWLATGALLAPLLRDPVRARFVNVVLAVALVGATSFAVLH